jgi:hypothetical protein
LFGPGAFLRSFEVLGPSASIARRPGRSRRDLSGGKPYRHGPVIRSHGLLQVGECASGRAGDEDQFCKGQRQELLLVHSPELEYQPVVEARRIQQHHGLVVQSVLPQLQDLGRFVQRAHAVGHHRYCVGHGE